MSETALLPKHPAKAIAQAIKSMKFRGDHFQDQARICRSHLKRLRGMDVENLSTRDLALLINILGYDD